MLVTFVFKPRVHWATDFLALFNVQPRAFEVARESPLDIDTVNLYMEAMWISTSSWSVVCNVLRKLERTAVHIKWLIQHIFPLLTDVIIIKTTKPE